MSFFIIIIVFLFLVLSLSFVKNGAKGTYLTAAVQRCCGGVALFLDGEALFLQRCCAEKRCGGTCVFGCLRLRTRLLERAFFRLRTAASVERARSDRSRARNLELPTHSKFLV